MPKANDRIAGKRADKWATFREATTNLSKSARAHYITDLRRFCKFVRKNPDQIIQERRRQLRSHDEHMRRTYERKVLEFYEHAKKNLGVRESAAYQMVVALRGWFSRNYCRLDFARRGPRKPKHVFRDHLPSLSDLRAILECSSVRDRAVFTLMAQTGLAPVDVCELRRGWFTRAIEADEYPALITTVDREKTRVPQRIIIGRDSGMALKRWLDARTDDDPRLFVEVRRKVLERDKDGKPTKWEVRPLKSRFIDAAFQRAVVRSRVKVPDEFRLRVYCLRKLFTTSGTKVMDRTWVDILIGHSLPGSLGAYVVPNDDDLLEAYGRLEPLISISEVVPTEKKIEAKVDERTSELGRVVEESGRQLKTLLSENKELKAKLRDVGRRIRTLEFLEARRLGLSVPELRELSADQAEFIRRIEREHPEWVSEK